MDEDFRTMVYMDEDFITMVYMDEKRASQFS
jgi:hypothetical protein